MKEYEGKHDLLVATESMEHTISTSDSYGSGVESTPEHNGLNHIQDSSISSEYDDSGSELDVCGE